MKTLTVRLPGPLLADIVEESRGRKISKSDVVRERLAPRPHRRRITSFNAIADLVGSANGLPTDLTGAQEGAFASHELRPETFSLTRALWLRLEAGCVRV